MVQWGIGANMAFRRAAALRVGQFDPYLGAGAPMRAGEEFDFELRVLGAGLATAHTSAFELTHLGVRENSAAKELFRGYTLGVGAAYAKNLRLRTPRVGRLFGTWLIGQSTVVVKAAAAGKRPLGLGLMLSLLKGCGKGMLLPLDTATKSFVRS
jgi:hypothetical protein